MRKQFDNYIKSGFVLKAEVQTNSEYSTPLVSSVEQHYKIRKAITQRTVPSGQTCTYHVICNFPKKTTNVVVIDTFPVGLDRFEDENCNVCDTDNHYIYHLFYPRTSKVERLCCFFIEAKQKKTYLCTSF